MPLSACAPWTAVLTDYIRGRYNQASPRGEHSTLSMTNPIRRNQPPIPVAQLHILLALATGDKHGYAIMSEVKAMTQGSLSMGPGTLYGTVKRMLGAGLIEETAERPDHELDDERRRYYRLTGLGASVLDAEIARMEHLVATARVKRTPVTREHNPGNR